MAMIRKMAILLMTIGMLCSVPDVMALQTATSPAPPRQSQPAQRQTQQPAPQPKAQKFQGQVVKMQANNAYGLQTSSGTFLLDNQAESQQFAGKVVVVTGTLDPNGAVIHVATIQMAG